MHFFPFLSGFQKKGPKGPGASKYFFELYNPLRLIRDEIKTKAQSGQSPAQVKIIFKNVLF